MSPSRSSSSSALALSSILNASLTHRSRSKTWVEWQRRSERVSVLTPLQTALAGAAAGLAGAIVLMPLVYLSRRVLDVRPRNAVVRNPLALGSILSEARAAPPDL